MVGDRVPAGWWPDGSVRGPEGANYPQSGQAVLLGGREDSGGLSIEGQGVADQEQKPTKRLARKRKERSEGTAAKRETRIG